VTTILLARHGESDWNAEMRWQGHVDRPLTRLGETQAHALAARLDGVPLTAVYASDLQRASATAAAVARRHGLEMVVRADLREVDCGSWAGRTNAELDPVEVDRWRQGGTGWSGGESYEMLTARLLGAIIAIASLHPQDQVLAVSHGAAIRAVLAAAAGVSFHEHRPHHPVTANGDLHEVVVADDGALLARPFVDPVRID
jgi:broad specificity phosphatase PhoE